MADLRIFTYLPNPRLAKALIAARFSGAEIEVIGDQPPKMLDWLWDFDARELSDADKGQLSAYARTGSVGFAGAKLYKTDAFLAAHPFGNVPAGFSGDGSVGIFESNSIMRAAARCGTQAHTLLGDGAMAQSRVDSFLDRSLAFALDVQRYLLAGDKLDAALHSTMSSSLESYLGGLERCLQSTEYIAGPSLTLADIAAICELCLLTNEGRFADKLEEMGLKVLMRDLSAFPKLGAHMQHLAADPRFSEDLGKYASKLLACWPG